MKKIFDFALICVIIIVAFYACSEDIFSPYEESLVFNSNDPRLEMIASVDSAKRMESQVETLTRSEYFNPDISINSGGKDLVLARYQHYSGYNALSLHSNLYIEFYIDDFNNRKIIYAEAMQATLVGTMPVGSRFTVVSEIPHCDIIYMDRRDDKVAFTVNVTLDYGNYFVISDDDRVDKTYSVLVNPFE